VLLHVEASEASCWPTTCRSRGQDASCSIPRSAEASRITVHRLPAIVRGRSVLFLRDGCRSRLRGSGRRGDQNWIWGAPPHEAVVWSAAPRWCEAAPCARAISGEKKKIRAGGRSASPCVVGLTRGLERPHEEKFSTRCEAGAGREREPQGRSVRIANDYRFERARRRLEGQEQRSPGP
jgi:hypothetical protein